jgi:hypothetical protein
MQDVAVDITTRKRLIAGAPKNPTTSAPEPAGGNRPVIMGYCRRTSMCASGNTSYCRRTSWCAGGIISRIQKKLNPDLDLGVGRVLVRDCGNSITVVGSITVVDAVAVGVKGGGRRRETRSPEKLVGGRPAGGRSSSEGGRPEVEARRREADEVVGA